MICQNCSFFLICLLLCLVSNQDHYWVSFHISAGIVTEIQYFGCWFMYDIDLHTLQEADDELHGML